MATTISKVLTELPQHKNVGELTCLGSGVVITWEFPSSFTLLKLHAMAYFFLTPILCGIMSRLSSLSLQCYHYVYNMDLYDLVELEDIAYNEFILLTQSKLFNSHVYLSNVLKASFMQLKHSGLDPS